jgi:hypothetical protein
MEMSGQHHAPAALSPGKEPRYLLDRRLGGLQNWSGRRGKDRDIAPNGTRTQTPRSYSPLLLDIASRYTHCAIPARLAMGENPKIGLEDVERTWKHCAIVHQSVVSYDV